MKVLFADPGFGKTHTCIEEVEEHLNRVGLNKINDVLYVTFTREAANEPLERLEAKTNTSYPRKHVKYFGTIHSICYKLLKQEVKYSKLKLLKKADYDNFNKEYNYNLEYDTRTNTFRGLNKNDKMINIYNLERNKTPFFKEELKRFKKVEEYNQFKEDYNEFKKKNEKIDFADMLDFFINDPYIKSPEVHLAVLDECQDNTNLLWDAWDKLAEFAKKNGRIVWAGDDKQEIYQFIGSSSSRFTNYKEQPGDSVVYRNFSRRMSPRVIDIAEYLRGMIVNKRDLGRTRTKKLRGDTETPFITQLWHYDKQLVDFVKANKENTVFLLSRTNYLLDIYTRWLFRIGLAFTLKSRKGTRFYPNYKKTPDNIQEADYNKMTEADPILNYHDQIQVMTVHKAKGKEADRVLFLTNITKRIEENLNDPITRDTELKVIYTACSRARDNFYYVTYENSGRKRELRYDTKLLWSY